MPLELRPAIPRADYQPAFDLAVPGFTVGWWDRATRLTHIDTDRFSIFELDEEIARVEVDPDSRIALEDYVELEISMPVVNIEFFEIRADQHRRGHGRQAIAMLSDHYQGRDLIAFSEGADEFWAGVEWRHVPRIDESRLYRPLFVCQRAWPGTDAR